MTTTSAVWCRSGLALSLAALVLPSLANEISLAPERAGQYQAGKGVDATFLKVYDTWKQSSVLWNEATQQYGSGVPIGTFGWGTGLWGLADWRTANLAPTSGMIEGSWSGRVGQIAFGNAEYKSTYDTTWTPVDIAPLFSSGVPLGSQDNWTSSFSGYIRVTEAGTYNFSVLHDDGFYFKLRGANAPALELSHDFLNPRDALGFSNNLQLGVGLYSFELGAYDRLQAGVVELSWSRDGGVLSRIPKANLLAFGDVTPVPEPGTWVMLLAGLMALGLVTSRGRLRH